MIMLWADRDLFTYPSITNEPLNFKPPLLKDPVSWSHTCHPTETDVPVQTADAT